jgi:hypothetical protein
VRDIEREARLRLNTRLQDWKAQAFRFGLEGEIERCEQAQDSHSRGKTEELKMAVTTVLPAVITSSGSGAERRALIDEFISRVASAGRKITRKDISMFAGYKDETDF